MYLAWQALADKQPLCVSAMLWESQEISSACDARKEKSFGCICEYKMTDVVARLVDHRLTMFLWCRMQGEACIPGSRGGGVKSLGNEIALLTQFLLWRNHSVTFDCMPSLIYSVFIVWAGSGAWCCYIINHKSGNCMCDLGSTFGWSVHLPLPTGASLWCTNAKSVCMGHVAVCYINATSFQVNNH